MPQHLLLLGAGFSRNWGGWLASEVFEYLLGIPEIEDLQHLLWRHKNTGGFEAALSELQVEFQRAGGLGPADRLRRFQAALKRMFDDMDKAFQNTAFEFQNSIERMVRTFLVRFDAIFTLNQDLLLDRHYLSWNGRSLPGMRQLPPWPSAFGDPGRWRPAPREEFALDAQCQPLIKLHGSTNWVSAEEGDLLIMGGDKTAGIRGNAILAWYFSLFQERLAQPGTRLMVIGYSFSDGHINQVLEASVRDHGLRIFVIDPNGVDVADTTRGAAIRPPNPYAGAFCGASRRTLREIFGSDQVEHGKVISFFR